MKRWFDDWKIETENERKNYVRLILRLPHTKSKQKFLMLTVKRNGGLHWLFSHFELALMNLSESVEITLPEDTKVVKTIYKELK